MLLLIGAAFAYYKYDKRWDSFVSDPRLVNRLIKRDSPVSWWISTILLFLSLILIFLALADPVNGREETKFPTTGKRIYLALDLSRSMLVQDISPDRLTKAKTLGVEIVEAFPNEKIGLISFSGKAWLEAPLTNDHHVLIENILSLNEETIPYGGSESAPLFDLIAEMEKEGKKTTETLLIMISDGEFHHEPSSKDIIQVEKLGYRIFTIAVGTKAGGYVPDKRQFDGKFRDHSGRPVLSTLKNKPLEDIARIGRGESFHDRNYDFVPRLKGVINTFSGEASTSKSIVSYNHIYNYFLTPALILLFLASIVSKFMNSIKALTTLAIICLCITTLEVQARGTFDQEVLEKFWKSLPKQQSPPALDEPVDKIIYEPGIKVLEEKLTKATRENRKKIHFAKGTAEYNSELYRDAIESFSNSLLSDDPTLQSESHYNLGNSTFKQAQKKLEDFADKEIHNLEEIIAYRQTVIDEIQNSLGHYRGSLHINPQHSNAQENYDYVNKFLEDLMKQQEQLMELFKEMQGGNEGEEEGNNEGEGKGGEKGSSGFTPEELEELRKKAEEEGEEQNPGNQGEEKEEGGSGGDKPEKKPGSGMNRDKALEMLRENSDMEGGNLRSGRQRYFRRPLKDW